MLNIRLVKQFFNGQDLIYKSRSHTFGTDSNISKIFSRIIFDTPSSFNITSLRAHTQGSSEFLTQLGNTFDEREPAMMNESDRIIATLSTIENPEVRATIRKIQENQNIFKSSVEYIRNDSPTFVKKDYATAARVLSSHPECIDEIDKELLDAHPDLYAIACLQDYTIINKVPKELLLENNDIVKNAINGKSENFYYLKEFLTDDILRAHRNDIYAFIDQHPSSIQDLRPQIITELPEALLEKTLMQIPSLLQYIPKELLEAKPELCLKILAKDITISTLIPEKVLMEHQEEIFAIVGNNHVNIRILPEVIIKDKAFIEKFMPAFISLITEDKDKESIVKESLLGFKDPSARIFLISKFIECLNNGTIDNLPKWKDTSSTTILFSSAIFESWKPSPEQRDNFLAYLTLHKTDLKSGDRRQVLINLLSNIHNIPDSKKIEFILKMIEPIAGESRKQYLDRTINAFKAFPLVAASFTPEAISTFTDLHFETLKNQLITKFIDEGLLTEELRETFLTKFMTSRMPAAIFTYSNNLTYDESLIPALKKFISDVCRDVFIEERHKNNSYKDILVSTLDNDRRALWEAGTSKGITINTPLPTNYLMSDSEDWQDLFLCGTEVQGSCQNVNGSPYNNKGLLGYLMDGKIRILTLKESIAGPIKARCLIKLIKKPDGKVAMLVEQGYPSDTSIQANTLKRFAKERADALGLDLYEVDHSATPQVFLESDVPNAAGVEYEDAMYKEDPSDTYKVCDGIYKVGAKKIE